jgi:hypothetical protein
MESPANRPRRRRHRRCCRRCRAARVVAAPFECHRCGLGFDPERPETFLRRPRLFPRWLWRPVEHALAGAVHGHVIEEMRRRAVEARVMASGRPSSAAPSDQEAGPVPEGYRARRYR